jgi:hypothetical protein
MHTEAHTRAPANREFEWMAKTAQELAAAGDVDALTVLCETSSKPLRAADEVSSVSGSGHSL